MRQTKYKLFEVTWKEIAANPPKICVEQKNYKQIKTLFIN